MIEVNRQFSLAEVVWADLRAAWPALPGVHRRRLAAAAGEALGAAWRAGVDLAGVPLHGLAFRETAEGIRVSVARPLLSPATRPLTPRDVVEAAAAWLRAAPEVEARDAVAFLRRFVRGEPMDRAGRRYFWRAVAAERDRSAARRAAEQYREHLREGLGQDGFMFEGEIQPCLRFGEELVEGAKPRRFIRRGFAGCCARGLGLTPAALLRALEAAEADGSLQPLKARSRLTFRMVLEGREVVVKRHDLARPAERLRFLFRASRARRAWAAARTLEAFDLPTPEPLALLEVYRGFVPVRSYYVCAFVRDAVPAYRWLKAGYRWLAPAGRAAFREKLRRALQDLYDHGLRHGDTKSTNLLLRHPGDPAAHELLWIDLESARAGVLPSRRALVRNLIQLNTSVRHWVPDQDRVRFLEALARRHPWLTAPRVAARIRARSIARMRKELVDRCGP